MSSARQLPPGIQMRWSKAEDVERIADCIAEAFHCKGEAVQHFPDKARRFMDGQYPFMTPEDYLVFEDTSRPSSPVVTCAAYLHERWTLDALELPVAHIDNAATLVDYQRKGLLRIANDATYERAVADGMPIMALMGGPHFYRSFGYEYAVDAGGGVDVRVDALPKLGDGAHEPFRLRRATADDAPTIAECYRSDHERFFVSLSLPEEFWRYHIAAEERPGAVGSYFRVRVLEDRAGAFRGAALLDCLPGDSYGAQLVTFARGVNRREVAPSLLREIARIGESLRTPHSSPEPLVQVSLHLASDDPMREALPPSCSPTMHRTNAWYVQIPDIPAFLRRIAPILEARLASSPFAGHTGQVSIDQFRYGLRMTFDGGKLAAVEKYDASTELPPLRTTIAPSVSHQLFLGYRSLAELIAWYPDVSAEDDVAPLLDVLFPKRPSFLVSI